MPQIACLCGQTVEASDADALATAYTEHHARLHTDIPISDDRRRELERAILRTRGWDGRKVALGPVEVKPLTPDLEREYIEYFDGPALADNPVWARCYCLPYHLSMPRASRTRGHPSRIARIARRRSVAARRAACWRSAAAASSAGATHLRGRRCRTSTSGRSLPRTILSTRARSSAMSSRRSIAARGSRGACSTAPVGCCERGFRQVEAYPPKQPPTEAASYHGRLSMYLDAGFEEVRDAGRYVVVRKMLERSHQAG